MRSQSIGACSAFGNRKWKAGFLTRQMKMKITNQSTIFRIYRVASKKSKTRCAVVPYLSAPLAYPPTVTLLTRRPIYPLIAQIVANKTGASSDTILTHSTAE